MSAIPQELILSLPNVSRETSQIKIAKRSQSDILNSRKAQALHRIEQMASELGRMQKLLDELRADVVHLTVE